MREFKTWHAYDDFAETVRKHRRFIYDDETKQFLDCLIETSESRISRWPVEVDSAPLWRAQLHGYSDPINVPFCAKRMKPEPERCTEGRANPKGIPFLYLSLEQETAMSEVRPWVGAVGTLARFMHVQELNLVDCLDGSKPPREEKEKHVWAQVNEAFSRPIRTSDSTAEYAPTQVMAEVIRSAKFDGILFGSSLAKEGVNMVLFDLNLANIIDDDRRLFRTESIECKFVFP